MKINEYGLEIEESCDNCKVWLEENRRLRDGWIILKDTIHEKSILLTPGGMKCGVGGELASAVPSVLKYLDRLCKRALEGEG